MPELSIFQILFALIVLIAAMGLSLRFPSLFVSVFLAYQLFKLYLRVYVPILSIGYTIDVATGMIAITGAFAHWMRFRHQSHWCRSTKRLLGLYALFLLLIVLSYPLTHAPNQALKKLLIYAVMTLFAILIPALYLVRLQDVKVLCKWLLAWALLASIMVLFFGQNYVADTGAVRMTAAYVNPLLIMEIVAIGCIVSLSGMFWNKSLLLFAPLAFVTFIYTGTRGPILLLAVIVLYFLFIARIQRLWLPALLTPIVVVLFLMISHYVDLSAGMVRVQKVGGGLSQRVEMIHTVIEQSKFSDWVIGGGVGNTCYLMSGADVWVYPHNSVVEVWAELGFSGLILILGLFGWALYTALRLRSDCHGRLKEFFPIVALAAMTLYCIGSSLKMSSFYANYHVWLYLSAMLVARERIILAFKPAVWQAPAAYDQTMYQADSLPGQLAPG